jgi:large subunit ribosomal protein L18
MDLKSKSGTEAAIKVAEEITKLALSKNIEEVVFDRGGYLYHGKVKAFAETARENGLKF